MCGSISGLHIAAHGSADLMSFNNGVLLTEFQDQYGSSSDEFQFSKFSLVASEA